MDCLEQKEFLQWNTRTKEHLCANFQDIGSSSKSWMLDMKYAISTIKMQILNHFFAKRFTIFLLYVCQVFINLQDHLHFFSHFVFSFMGQLFMDDPITSWYYQLTNFNFTALEFYQASPSMQQLGIDRNNDVFIGKTTEIKTNFWNVFGALIHK